jgi:hypothetical protein
MTNFMEQSPFWKPSGRSAGQEINSSLWCPKVHYRVHNIPQFQPILTVLNKSTHTIHF